MRIVPMVFCLVIFAANVPALARPIIWECAMKPGESRAVGPDSYEEIDGVLIASRGDFGREQEKYKITRESKDGLVAELSSTSAGALGLSLIFLNKKTGQFRSASIYTNGWFESFEGKCIQK